jgi:hypothetical protein
MVFKMPLSSPRRIVITPAWGFVAVDFGREITFFSVNGQFLHTYAHDCLFAYWTAIRSRNDFDYILYTDLKGNLVIFEAYQPQNAAQLVQLLWPVCFMDYVRESDCLVVVSTTGKVVFIAHPLSELPNAK